MGDRVGLSFGIRLGIGRGVGIAFGLLLGWPGIGAIAQAEPTPSIAAPIRPPQVCPDGLEDLTALLLRDLPSYTNRVNQRASRLERGRDIPGHLILAGRPDYQPLSLGPGQYQPTTDDEPEQLFFTTLERQYYGDRGVLLERYHWAFLTHADGVWRLALMVSSWGDHQGGGPPSPPEDSSQGAIAQAIRLWLRDCEAGEVPLSPAQPSPEAVNRPQ